MNSKQIKKHIVAALLITVGSYLFYTSIFKQTLLLLTKNNEWPLPPFIFTLVWLFLVVILIDLIYRTKYSILATLPVYFACFFTAKDALWAGEILWHRNYWLIVVLIAIYVLALSVVIYRFDPAFKWVFGRKPNANDETPMQQWRQTTFWSKATSILGFCIIMAIALWVPYKVVLTTGYLRNYHTVTKHATVISLGATRGRNFYHRFWVIELDGNREVFWVYAAANTEDEGKNTCSTYSSVEPGATLTLVGREGVFGFSYDQVIQIKNVKGEVICQNDRTAFRYDM